MGDTDPSVIQIEYDGNDITNSVIVSSASFDSQLAASPGMFEFTVRDPDRVLSFTTGKEVGFWVDGVKLFGGYVTQVTRKWALPVDDTSRPVLSRQWVLRGVDFNILFDKRVLRNTDNYLEQIPNFQAGRQDGALVRKLVEGSGGDGPYIDFPAGFDGSTFVENVGEVNPDAEGAWMQQGTLWREQMIDFADWTGAIWYIDANKNLIWRALENSEAAWGFSDVPNKRPVTGSGSFEGSTIGFRDADINEDGSFIVNDALVWGGSEFTGPGGTVFGRFDADTSIANHGRWQYSETGFGQLGYQSQNGVNTRARVIVNGSPTALQPGAVDQDSTRGLRFSQWQIKLAWHAHDVPKIAGVPQHLRPGDLTTLIFYVLGTDNAHPLIQQLPLRQVRVSFPTLAETGDSYVRFEGFWGLQLDDPYTLWGYIRSNRRRIQQTLISTANNAVSTTVYGAFVQEAPDPDPDGTNRLFTLQFGFISQTLQVYVGGLLQLLGEHYAETDPAAGTFTFISAPPAGVNIWVVYRALGS